MKHFIISVGIIPFIALAGCSGAQTDYERGDDITADNRVISANKEGKLFGEGGLSLNIGTDDSKPGNDLGINKHLWRGALDTLDFLPLASTDPHGGVIVTDWAATANAPNERFKVTAYISSPDLKPDGLKVTIHRQQQNHGTWIEAPVSADTERELEDAIFTRARQLKQADKT